MIEVSSNGNEWNARTLVVPISILPPYYKTYWFITVILAVFALFVYAFFKLKILSYNKRVLINFAISIAKRFSSEEKYIVIREQGKDVKVISSNIMYVKSSGNYCEIQTNNKKFLARLKISDFLKMVPDKENYLRIHRSCIVRIDKITEKSKDCVVMEDVELKVSDTYMTDFRKIQF